MLTLLSPAKKMNLTPAPASAHWSEPALWTDAQPLLECLQSTSTAELKRLMKLSDALATLNHARHSVMTAELSPANSKQAAFTFAGDVCWGLDPLTVDADGWRWAQDRLAFLSGLFGLLRPLDGIQAYRLEMGTRLQNPRGKNLYAYWGEAVSARINETTRSHVDRTVVNLASQEYSKVVNKSLLEGEMITIGFKELRDSGPTTIGVVAKRSRGKFARWMIDQRVESADQLRDFNVDDYAFDAALSTDDSWIFSRPDQPGRMKREFQARKERDQRLFA